MYNLNVNVTTSASSLSVMESSFTPKTPEILNTLIAMSNPFDTYPGSSGPIHTNNQMHHHNHHGGSRVPASPPEGEVFAHPGSMPPPSVQHTCSQLIKEGLKLTIQSKRKHSGGSDTSLSLGDADFCNKLAKHSYPSPLGGNGNGVGSSGDDEVSVSSPEALWLTAEDAERRRRRRERNKIAATKCRLKKRERTVNLVQESEILETQNHDLKSQIQDLETQRRQLMDMLSIHNQTCVKSVGNTIVNNNHYVTSVPPEHQHGHQVHPQHQQQQQQQPPQPQSQPQHHPQQQQQLHQHQYADPYQHYVTTPCTPCSPPQESPSPGFVHDVAYVQQTGLDSGCLA